MNGTMNRVDHVVWVVRAENIKQYVEEFTALYGVDFDFRDGPRNDRSPVQTYVAWDAGLELIAPFESPDARPIAEHPVASKLAAHLDEHGEGIFGVVFRVPDLEEAVARASALGYAPSSVAPHLADKAARMKTHGAWTKKVLDIHETFISTFLNTHVIFGEFEYPDEVADASTHEQGSP